VRIAFLFNHDQVHQVAHSLPVALALASRPDAPEIVLLTANDAMTGEIMRLAGDRIGGRLALRQIGLTSLSSRALATLLDPVLPARKVLLYRDHLDLFAGLDALVVAEKTSLLLKTRYGLDRLKMIHTRHGAGDRAVGFDKASAGFDLVLVAGEKIRDRLIRDAGLDPARLAVVGYPKFDLARFTRPAAPLFDNDRPVVLYNPHPSPHLSSWYRMGRALLDWFVDNPRYNLIFAPHVMLFARKFVLSIDKFSLAFPGRIAARYRAAPNIHIDLGSPLSTDMTYTNAADIYLGDVSSQIYEFLIRPRPCLFADAHETAWEGDANYAHWQAGPVFRTPDALGETLDRAIAGHEATWAPTQRALFARSFDLTEVPSAERAADAIASRLRGLD
jgi:hypothetical protein